MQEAQKDRATNPTEDVTFESPISHEPQLKRPWVELPAWAMRVFKEADKDPVEAMCFVPITVPNEKIIGAANANMIKNDAIRTLRVAMSRIQKELKKPPNEFNEEELISNIMLLKLDEDLRMELMILIMTKAGYEIDEINRIMRQVQEREFNENIRKNKKQSPDLTEELEQKAERLFKQIQQEDDTNKAKMLLEKFLKRLHVDFKKTDLNKEQKERITKTRNAVLSFKIPDTHVDPSGNKTNISRQTADKQMPKINDSLPRAELLSASSKADYPVRRTSPSLPTRPENAPSSIV